MRQQFAVAVCLAFMTLPTTARSMTTTPPPSPPPPQRLFFSGHSLLDQPLPRDVAAIAASLGAPLQWSRQYREGSSIRDRTAADGDAVFAEWRAPRAVQGGAYDTLVVTEQHALIGALVWHDTVRELRRVHERFIAANARGRTWFYEPWLTLDNRADPRRWIAYERAASPIWQCVVARINTSLAAEGRADRIEPLPAAAVLAALVERATQGSGLPGLSGATPRATIDRLFRDDVHLTPLGSYFMSLVVVASLNERSTQGAAVPDGIDAGAARVLQQLAWPLVQQERVQRSALTLDACRRRLQSDFIGLHTNYLRDAVLAPQMGTVRAHARALKWRAQWQWRLRSTAGRHPLRHDAASDRGHWLAP
jgi:hypothetical protein